MGASGAERRSGHENVGHCAGEQDFFFLGVAQKIRAHQEDYVLELRYA
jgi:hypothetical protein